VKSADTPWNVLSIIFVIILRVNFSILWTQFSVAYTAPLTILPRQKTMMTLHNMLCIRLKNLFFLLKVRYAKILVKLSLSYVVIRDIQLWSDLLHISFSHYPSFKLTQIPSPIRVKNIHRRFGMPLEMQRNVCLFIYFPCF
jgi:hypothetical protein